MPKFELSEIEIEECLSEVISGKKIFYYEDEIMCMRHPNSKDRDGARTVYVSKYRELEKTGIPKKEELKIILLKAGALNNTFYSQKKKLEDKVESICKAREKTGSIAQRISMEADITMFCEQLQLMEEQEAILMINCLEYNAESFRINYLISRCTMYGIELDKNKWETYMDFLKETDIKLISFCKKKYQEMEQGISSKILRALARTEEWRRRWEISKKTGSPVFDGVSSDWDKNKINLCYWSGFYDNIIDRFHLSDYSILQDDEKLFEMIRKYNSDGQVERNNSENSESISVGTPFKIRY